MLNRWKEAINVTGRLVTMFLSTSFYFHSNYKTDLWNFNKKCFQLRVCWLVVVYIRNFENQQWSVDWESLGTIVLRCSSQILYFKYMIQFMWILWSWRKRRVLIVYLTSPEYSENSYRNYLSNPAKFWVNYCGVEKYQPAHKAASTGQARTDKASVKTTACVVLYHLCCQSKNVKANT